MPRKTVHFPLPSVFINIKFEEKEEMIKFINTPKFALIFSELSELAMQVSPNAQVSSKTNPKEVK